jgi:hypothetical protein
VSVTAPSVRMIGRRLTLGCTAVKRAANELAEVLG